MRLFRKIRVYYHIRRADLIITKTTYRIDEKKTRHKYIFANLLGMDQAKEVRQNIRNGVYDNGLANNYPHPN